MVSVQVNTLLRKWLDQKSFLAQHLTLFCSSSTPIKKAKAAQWEFCTPDFQQSKEFLHVRTAGDSRGCFLCLHLL